MRSRCCHVFDSGGMYVVVGTTSLDGGILFTSNSAKDKGGKINGLLKLDCDFFVHVFILRIYSPAIISDIESS